jgi:hypothetical protein
MNTSPAPDVDRVLHRMGRSAFGYRSFPNPVDDAPTLASMGPGVDAPVAMPGAMADAAPAPFSLIGAALPPSVEADRAPVAVAPLANPFQQAGLPLPAPPGAPAGDRRPTSLSDVFRILSGHASGAPPRRGTGAQEASFPFRRR